MSVQRKAHVGSREANLRRAKTVVVRPGVATVVIAVAVACLPSIAVADELTEEESAVRIHGFVSQGALWTNRNNYLAHTERGSLEFTEAALTFSKQLDPKLRVGFQLFARDLGTTGNYDAKLDWFGLDYRWRDWLGLRAGRNKIPYGLYNETLDVDAANSVILVPQGVYRTTNRDFLLAQTGIELYGYRPIGRLGALDYRAYFGTIFLGLESSPFVQIIEIDVPWVTGGRLMWETPMKGMRIGGSVLAGEINGDFLQIGMPVSIATRQTLTLASFEYSDDPLTFVVEYGRGFGKGSSTTPMGMEMVKVTAEWGHALVSYRLRPWLQPSLYYSLYYPNVDVRVGKESRQHDAAATLRFDITPSWLLKVEAHAMRGTAQLSAELNDGLPPSQLRNKWYLLAAKTTVYF